MPFFSAVRNINIQLCSITTGRNRWVNWALSYTEVSGYRLHISDFITLGHVVSAEKVGRWHLCQVRSLKPETSVEWHTGVRLPVCRDGIIRGGTNPINPKIESSRLMDGSVEQDKLINLPCASNTLSERVKHGNQLHKRKCRLPVAMTTAAAVWQPSSLTET